jgi:hypothetical protein
LVVAVQVETLRGKLGATKMGDRVATARPPELEAKMKKMKEKREREEKARLEEQKGGKKRVKGGGDFLENLGAWGPTPPPLCPPASPVPTGCASD